MNSYSWREQWRERGGVEFRRYEYSLLELCSDLHMAVSGSGDGMPTELENAVVVEIEKRLRDWRSPTSPFDESVRAMCVAVLDEHMRWSK